MPRLGPYALGAFSCFKMSCSAVANISLGNKAEMNNGALRNLLHVSGLTPGFMNSK